MAKRKRRSLIAGKGGEGSDGAGSGPDGVDDAGSHPVLPEPSAEAAASEGSPAATPEPSDEPADPWAAPASAPTRSVGEFAPSGFVEEEPAALSDAAEEPDPWTAPARAEAPDPWAATPAKPATDTLVEVTEHTNKAGTLYTSVAAQESDSTDSGWSNSAFRGGGQPSLPPGWDSPDVEEAPKQAPVSPWKAKAEFFSDEPPTEEHPSAVYEDRSPRYSAPMNVPEPPPIPGMYQGSAPPAPAPAASGKSFGAPPAAPAAAPNAGAANRPSYLPPETPKRPMQRSPTPRPAQRTGSADDDEPEKGGGLPIVPIIGFAAIVLLFVVVALGALMYGGSGPTLPPPPQKVDLPPPPPAEVPAVPPEGGTPTDNVPPLPPVAPVPPSEVPVAPKEIKAPAVPKDAKKDVKVVKSPVAKGTLKVRSNRRVLVKINGQPKDYTPLDLPTDSGKYTISAALPGKPDSEQTFTVDLKPGVIEPVNFTF